MMNDFTTTELQARGRYRVRLWDAYINDYTLEWDFSSFGEALTHARRLSSLYEANCYASNQLNVVEFDICVVWHYECQTVGYIENDIIDTIECVDDMGKFWLPVIATEYVESFC